MLLPRGTEHCTFQKAMVSSGFSHFTKVKVFSWLENSSRLHCSQRVVLLFEGFFNYYSTFMYKKPRRKEEQLAASPQQDAPM